MIDSDTGSTVPRWRLGRELAKLREQSGLKTAQIESRTGFSRSKIYRMETGKSPSRRADVEILCQIYQAPARLAKALTALASETTKTGWWHSYGDVIPEWFELFAGMEAYAESMDIYEPELVTGLLQTHDYAYDVMSTADANGDDEEIERHVDLRLARQARLTGEEAPRLHVILNEAVIRRPVGGPTSMAEQLRHIINVSHRDNVTVRVLPFSVGVHAAMLAGFTYLRFPDRLVPDVVYHDTRTGALYLDKAAQRKSYRQMWRDIDTRALDPAASRDMMATAAKEYET
ncbi:transcriptional regulator [Actinocatenispora thailandica]|uniref:Transcriptional regulator n=1 Tax=Actinocatenispora thailandica TaxID=227318 RepID=A0A7R7I0H0_9ACTN|nr:helix-turn-helix transcriptional regulator [Actinocatenispora thailandica]BCJ38509.1 transcriptional regulator [Actinocatenispora thailandica]